ncbi:3-hydroxyacyl-CoA dehydrogenase family protein [Micromonospora sp. NPDC005163]
MTAGQLPASVGVLGGGRMGAGIAHAFLVSGSRVVVVDANEVATAAARAAVEDLVERSATRGTLQDEPTAVCGRLVADPRLDALKGCELVVEAVPEDRPLKQRLLGGVSAVVGTDTVLASNTSSFSISRLAESVSAPERFLGLHFFNPVPSSSLVEIVVGRQTDARLVTRAQSWVTALGMTPVTVADSPGFATSRLGVALGLEAIRMIEEGVAPAEEIDAAITLGYRHPVGPLRLTDLVGLEVRLGVARHLAAELGPRFEPPQLLIDKVAAGELGRKTGQGFYTW